METKELFAQAMAAADGCLKHVETEQFSQPTPCSEWDLHDLLHHMVYELLWVPDMLAGKTVAEVGDKYESDILGDNFQAAWRQAADAARSAVEAADPHMIVHTSFGDITADEYITQIGCDMYVHTWDADQATLCSLRFDPAAARAMYDYFQPNVEGWRNAGALGPAVSVPDNAPLDDRLLGMLGRQPINAVAG